MVAKVIEGTIVLIVVYLVLVNAKGFSSIVGVSTAGYSNVIKTFQGR